MRLILAALVVSVPAAAQVTIDSRGVRAGGTVIDSTGVHSASGSVASTGVHRGLRHAAGADVTISTNAGRRSVDCGGAGLTINGNRNRLRIANCRSITVAGNQNDLAIGFARSGSLSLVGNRNQVNWHAPRDVAVRVSNVGTRNAVMRS